MSETKMPAVEVGDESAERELSSYELAFHVLPTIAEGEVSTVFQKVKDIITKNKGELGVEETPVRTDLAYEIVKYLEGRNRKFSSAYFGWVRFEAEPVVVAKITEKVNGMNELLRFLFVKLDKVEEANPFFYHEALDEVKIETIDVDSNKEVKEKEVKEEASEEVEKVEKEVEEEVEEVKDGEESTDKV